VMTKQIRNGSFEQAYKSLENLLTDESITPFMMVDMAIDSSERQKRFVFNAETDISQILRLSNYEELSPALQEQLGDAIDNGEGSITLTLPSSETIRSSHQINKFLNQVTITVPLSLTDRTGLDYSGVLNINADGLPAGSISEITHDLTRLRNLSIVICCAVIVFLIIIFLLTRLSRKRR